MKHGRKFLAFFLAVVMCVGLMAGCSSSDSSEEAADTEAAEEEAGEEGAGEEEEEAGEESAASGETNPLSNLNIRLALAKSFDKTAITQTLLKDGSVEADYFVPEKLAVGPSGADFREEAGTYENWEYDVEAAQAYWAAGLEELGVDSLSLNFMVEDSDAPQKIATFLQSEWQNNLEGLTVTLTVEPKKARLDDMSSGNYEFGLTRWGPDYSDPMTDLDVFTTESSTNYGGWSNEEYDETIESAKYGELALDVEARWDALHDCEDMLAEDCVILPVYQQSIARLVSPEVSNVYFYSTGANYYFKYTEKDSDEDNTLYYQIDTLIDSLNPQIANDGYSFSMLGQIVEGLYVRDEDGNAVLGVADSEDISEDGLTYTFHIRDDAEWSDGTPVTADDFVYAWQVLADPLTASEYQFFVETACIENASEVMSGEMDPEELGVEAVDDKTLVVHLSSPCAVFESLMTFASFLPVNRAFAEECGDSFATSPDTLLCNGPFVITDYEPSATTIRAEKNENYWDAGSVSLDGVEWQVIQEPQTAAMSYESGNLDIVTLTGDLIEQYEEDDTFSTTQDGYMWYITVNLAE